MRRAVAWNKQLAIKVMQCTDDFQVVHASLAKEMAELAILEQKLSIGQEEAEKHRYMAFHDNLTGLPNRALFNDRLEQVLLHAQRHECDLSILFIDIDKFKLINDTYGHDIGDNVLQIVGAQLQACVRQEDTVARIGGDEFMCLIMGAKEYASIVEIVTAMIKAISQACACIAVDLVVRPSIGIAFFPQDGMTPELLMKNADKKMYTAKSHEIGYCINETDYCIAKRLS